MVEPCLIPTLEHTDTRDSWEQELVGPDDLTYYTWQVREREQLKMLARFVSGCTGIPLTLTENLRG